MGPSSDKRNFLPTSLMIFTPLEIHSSFEFSSTHYLNALLFILFPCRHIQTPFVSKKTTQKVSECVRKQRARTQSSTMAGSSLESRLAIARPDYLHATDNEGTDFLGIDNTFTQTEHLPCTMHLFLSHAS